MKIIQPFDLKVKSIDSLLYDKQIIKTDANNIAWQSSIFPKSTKLNIPPKYSRSNIVTQVDDLLFADYIIVDNLTSIILLDNNTKRKIIKCTVFGDIENSVKRWTALNIPITYIEDPVIFTESDVREIKQEENLTNYNTSVLFDINLVDKKEIKSFPKKQSIDTKYNDKATLEQILKWGKEQGINYIYCINEHRINVITDDYVLPYIYYTITGSK